MKPLENIEFRRYDNHGSGAFGASRGLRKHIGVDLKAEPGEKVYAPFAGEITKYGWAYANEDYRYIEITGENHRVRLFYSELDPAHFVGKEIFEDQFLGVIQDLTTKYEGITNHLHFELYDLAGNIIDPTLLFDGKKKSSC